MLGIIGSNERALSLAFIAKKEGLDVTIFGNTDYLLEPYLPNEVMRQSINWDLVSFLDRPKYDLWRMDHFLTKNRNYNTQSDHEAPPFIKKETWICYLDRCVTQLKQMGVVFREEPITSFSINNALLNNKERVMYDQVCIAEEPARKIQPLYIKPEDYNKLSSMLWTHTSKLRILVIPTGNEDYSMRASTYLKEMGHSVTYLFDDYREFKFSDYSVPSFKEWGYKTALGSFYREFLKDKPSRRSYLNKVDAFYSIKRETLDSFRRSGVKLLKYNSLNSLSKLKETIQLEEFDYFIDLRPGELDVNALKPNTIVVPDKDSPIHSLVTEGMRCPTGPIYVTGRLAEFFDGPRQRFVSSAGITSLEIVKDIKKRYV